MARVTNLRSEGITLLRWRVLPKSFVWIDPQGRQLTDVPPYVAYSVQAKALADRGFLNIEGYTPSTDKPPTSGTVQRTVLPERRKKDKSRR